MSAHAAMQAARNHLLGNALSSLMVLAIIMALPKDATPESLLRLAMTAGFFLFAICLLWCLTEPLDDYLAKRFAWHYEGAGAAIHHTLTLLRVNLMAVIDPLASIAMATVGFIALDVLSAWPAFDLLQPLVPVWQWGWFAGLIALVAVPLVRGRQLFQVLNLRHQLREQVETMRYTPKTPADAETDRRRAAEVPVTVLGDERFRAGGFDWEWPDFYKNLVVLRPDRKRKNPLRAQCPARRTDRLDRNVPLAGRRPDPRSQRGFQGQDRRADAPRRPRARPAGPRSRQSGELPLESLRHPGRCVRGRQPVRRGLRNAGPPATRRERSSTSRPRAFSRRP